ncbi:MAG: hypothetical protein KC635_29575 [Myxococcales bacterium]|nr:hypothetical protein [Myxococcales bacterium]MCB9731173.1 hypothetical protein [Deltaproteobacteria bacterium]
MAREARGQASSSRERPAHLRVVVRPLPKVVFFYLTWLASLVCAIATEADAVPWAGAVWMSAFLFNLLVISFDFNEERSLIVVLLIVVAFLALLYAGALADVGSFVEKLKPVMNATFYWMVFGAFSVIFLFVWLQSRINYWIIEPNEVVHRYGLFPKMKRFPTESLRWDKSVPDLLERLLLGSGTIVLTTPSEKFPIVIDHVLRIDTVDDRIAAVLGVKQVVSTDGSVESRKKYNDREDD